MENQDIYTMLVRHEQQLKAIERDIGDVKEVQTEIRAMNETLVTLATELKHTNQHLSGQEKKIEEMDKAPKNRLDQITGAIIAAVSGGLVSLVINLLT